MDFIQDLKSALKDYANEIDEYLKNHGPKEDEWVEREIFRPIVWENDKGPYYTTVSYVSANIKKRELPYLRRKELEYNLVMNLSGPKILGEILQREHEKHHPIEPRPDPSEGRGEFIYWLITNSARAPHIVTFAGHLLCGTYSIENAIELFIREYRKMNPVIFRPSEHRRFRHQIFVKGISCEEGHDVGLFRIRRPVAKDFPYRTDVHPEEQDGYPAGYDIHSIIEWDYLGDKYDIPVAHMIRYLRLGIGGNWTPRYARTFDIPIVERLVPKVNHKFHKNLTAAPDQPHLSREEFDHDITTSMFSTNLASWFRENAGIIKTPFTRSGKIAVRLRRAIEMYEDALIRKPIESVLFAVIGLESLYSSSDRGELRIGVPQRVTALLSSLFSNNQSDFFDHIYDAYGIRNSFVHGGIPDEKETTWLAFKLCEYLRLSILIWSLLPVESGGEIDRMNKLLQRSLVDESAKKEIEQLLSPISEKIKGNHHKISIEKYTLILKE